MDLHTSKTKDAQPWNKRQLVGEKLQLNLREIWAIPIRLQLAGHRRKVGMTFGSGRGYSNLLLITYFHLISSILIVLP